MRCSTLLTDPSIDEPFGLIHLEAMASGTPVVASASGGPSATSSPAAPRAVARVVAGVPPPPRFSV
ncbi:glycosyltransferase [Streptomyces goshikiensis]|uniref:Glycosyltransferase n=1 Tax=Streptomyces goshikiensis TaxID=1942 RepID=A0ABZ1RVD4_9ACTN|nr:MULTISPECIES: glycosyltransferase [Streptomyces]